MVNNMATKRPMIKQPAVDLVNSPPHYTGSSIECIDAIEAALTREEFIGFLRGQVFRYTWRLGKKDDPIQDASKAQWYQNKLIEVLKTSPT